MLEVCGGVAILALLAHLAHCLHEYFKELEECS
jgi:hypothetical protein